MKFSGNMSMDISCTEKYIVTKEINQCSFYGNMFQYSINFSYLLWHNLKTIQSIFMNFSGEIDIVFSNT